MELSKRIYRLLQRAYPQRYLREYGEPMRQVFADQLGDAHESRNLIRFWLRTLIDWVRSVPRQHLEATPKRRHGFGSFSEESRYAIFNACHEARSFARSEITLEHLLLGTLRSHPSRLNPDAVKRIVAEVEALEPGERRVAPQQDLPLNQECRSALWRAGDEAARCGASQVGTHHLLKAIEQMEGSAASRLLRKYKPLS